MTSLNEKYNQIKNLAPRRRGIQFERLWYEVFERENILLERSYFNESGSQQIDGAIEINNRIFLTEVKWEKSETLAASKLYSFLGKINSKIEGTLGLFISYHELSDNFISATRAGMKQNCIIINGKENIIPIIKGDIILQDYIWYIYQQASTRNRICIPVSEFKSLPKKSTSKQNDSKWPEIYEALISEDDNGEFEVKLDSNYDQIGSLSEKTITLYPFLHKNRTIANKLSYLIDTLIENDEENFYQSLVTKLASLHWLKYADDSLLSKTKNLSNVEQKKADKIALKALDYLREHYGQWEEENSASLIVDFLLDNLSDKTMNKVYCAYSSIYCDKARKSHYPQKMFADRLFSAISAKDRFKKIQSEIAEYVSIEKEAERIFGEDEVENEKYVIRITKIRFSRIISESNTKDINSILGEMYKKA